MVKKQTAKNRAFLVEKVNYITEQEKLSGHLNSFGDPVGLCFLAGHINCFHKDSSPIDRNDTVCPLKTSHVTKKHNILMTCGTGTIRVSIACTNNSYLNANANSESEGNVECRMEYA
jgi:hypothetical protein